MAELVAEVPGGLERYRPQLRYFLLDQGRLAEEELAPLRNLAAALFRLEKSREVADVERVLANLLEWLRSPEEGSLRQAFAVWVRKVLSSRLPDVQIPQVTDLMEVKTMLAERVTEWTRQWKEEGLQQGREQGLQEGLERGLETGRERGREETLERLREALLQELGARFGPLSERVREQAGALRSVEEMVQLIARVATAPSLEALGLAGSGSSTKPR